MTNQWILTIAFVIGSFLAGLVAQKVAIRVLVRLSEKTRWKLDDFLVGALRGYLPLLAVLIGAYAATFSAPLPLRVLQPTSRLLLAAILLTVTLMSMRFLGAAASYYAGRVVPTTTSIFKNLVNLLVLIFGILVICQTMGINITPVITALGIGGLAVALALQDTLSNLFAGIHIIAVKQIRPGDYVRLDSGEEGYVTDIGWRNTTIRMLRNNLVIVPNSRVASAVVTNYSLPEKELSVIVQVGVSYDSDLEKVERVTLEVAREVLRREPGGVESFEPLVRFHTFGDSSIDLSVILRVKEFVDQYRLKHEFVKALHKRYREEGIEIPFPQRVVHVTGGSA
jgi:small-conductance mechanosensitive channel